MRLGSGLRPKVVGILLLVGPGLGCSLNTIAVNKLGNAMAGSNSTYASDDDPELVRAATPFALKLMESLLEETPRHRGLLLATASGFTQYSFAFVHQDADELEDTDLGAAVAGWDRAARLYLRARDYGLRGLEVEHEGFAALLLTDADAALSMTDVDDVALLYWTSTSWTAAISLSIDNTDLVGDMPVAEAIIDRALLLDETYDFGAIHTFLVTYEMVRQGGEGDPADRSRSHFHRAMELTDGQLAQPLVSLAEAVAVVEQNRSEFDSLLRRALAIDPDVRVEWRVANMVAQRRARWLLERVDWLFLD